MSSYRLGSSLWFSRTRKYPEVCVQPWQDSMQWLLPDLEQLVLLPIKFEKRRDMLRFGCILLERLRFDGLCVYLRVVRRQFERIQILGGPGFQLFVSFFHHSSTFQLAQAGCVVAVDLVIVRGTSDVIQTLLITRNHPRYQERGERIPGKSVVDFGCESPVIVPAIFFQFHCST